MNVRRLAIAILCAGLIGCGSSANLDFENVVGIPPGNGAGTALSGKFTTLFTYTSSGCADITLLNAPSKGDTDSKEVTVTQSDGAIMFDKLGAKVRGSISFENEFDVGGAGVIDRGDQEDNILRTVRLTGEFSDGNSFSGNGEERLAGRINNEFFDCSFSFEVSGIREE